MEKKCFTEILVLHPKSVVCGSKNSMHTDAVRTLQKVDKCPNCTSHVLPSTFSFKTETYADSYGGHKDRELKSTENQEIHIRQYCFSSMKKMYLLFVSILISYGLLLQMNRLKQGRGRIKKNYGKRS